jgi:cleavage and polyadenylation specificity factor subunit 3
MFDCGIHPAHTGAAQLYSEKKMCGCDFAGQIRALQHKCACGAGLSSLPMMDNQSLANIDVALITHFHLDHCAALPCLVANTDFDGQIFMTHATKNIFYTMMKDMLRMHKKDPARYLCSAEDLEATMSRVSVINFHQTVTVDGIQITPYRCEQ